MLHVVLNGWGWVWDREFIEAFLSVLAMGRWGFCVGASIIGNFLIQCNELVRLVMYCLFAVLVVVHIWRDVYERSL